MAKVKVWQPLATEDLPLGLASSLRAANHNQPRRQWMVCEQVVVTTEDTSSAELLRLKEQVKALERALDRRKKEVTTQDVYPLVRDKISKGETISCGKEQYPIYRQALKRFVEYADAALEHTFGNIARNEIRRLDRLHGYSVDENA